MKMSEYYKQFPVVVMISKDFSEGQVRIVERQHSNGRFTKTVFSKAYKEGINGRYKPYWKPISDLEGDSSILEILSPATDLDLIRIQVLKEQQRHIQGEIDSLKFRRKLTR